MSHEYRLWVQDRSNNSSRDISSYHSNFTAQTTYSLARTGRSSSRISSYHTCQQSSQSICEQKLGLQTVFGVVGLDCRPIKRRMGRLN
jgi:hypothetical protein